MRHRFWFLWAEYSSIFFDQSFLTFHIAVTIIHAKKTYFQESWLANMEFDELVRVAVDDKRQAKCNLYRGRSKEFKVVRS